MKKLFTLFALMLVCIGQVSAYDFEVDGIYYNKSGSNATVTNNTRNPYSGSVVIPASVTHEGKNYSVTSIGEYAFFYCSGLTSVSIPNTVKSIGDGAFYECSSLTSITIPNSVKSIGDGAFYECSSLTSITIPNSVTSIGDNAFFDCRGLSSITIPNSVTSIGNAAFCDCSGLTNVTIGNSVTSIGNSAFSGCSSLTSVTIPNSVTSIGNSAFSGCSSLTSITIPNSVTSIGDGAFSDCSSLPIINDVRYADCYAIESTDKNMTSYTLKEGTRFIGNKAFCDCCNLTSINIPNSVTSIGYYAFYNCSSLKSINIPNSVTEIDAGTFKNCNSLKSIIIPNNVSYISEEAFAGSGLTSINIPNSVNEIDEEAFAECHNLTSATLSNNLTCIDWGLFLNCSKLTSIIIPKGVTEIWGGAFYGCSSLKSITCLPVLPPNCVEEDGYTVFDTDCYNTAQVYVPNSGNALASYQTAKEWNKFIHIQAKDLITTYTISATSSNSTMGTVSGGGTYEEGKIVTLTAMPYSGYRFVKWSDGTTVNPYTFKATKDVMLTAYFEKLSVKSDVLKADDIKANKCYIIYTTERGGLTVMSESDTRVWGTRESGMGQEVDAKNKLQHFAFVKENGNLYLYSVAAGKFVSATQKGELTEKPSAPIFFANADAETVRLVFDAGHNINLGRQKQITIDNWTTKDAGNSFVIKEAGDFFGKSDVLKAEDVKVNKCYIIYTAKRGGLTVTSESDTRIWGTGESGVGQEVDAKNKLQHFAFVKENGNLYLYSVAAGKFVSATEKGELTEKPSAPISFANADAETVRLVFDADHNINLGGNKQIVIDDWTKKDAGNSFVIMEAADFSGVVTGLATVGTDNTATPIYDLQGRMVKCWPGRRGVSIVNGKKIIK